MRMERWFPLETERLLLREFRASDEADLHAAGSDAEVARFVHWGPNKPEQTLEVLSSWLKKQRQWPRDSVELGIELKGESRLIGTIRLSITDKNNRTADFGYALNRQYWNRGYTTEATQALIDTAFTRLDMHRVFATCDVRNAASWRVMEKLGMRREGLFRKDILQKGEWRDTYLYAVLEEKWSSLKPQQ
jgi:[ribosomal protein S5]-alanine N-acetyltransferase